MVGTIYPLGIDGPTQLPLVVDLVSPVRAADVNNLRNAVIAAEKELGINPSGTFGTIRDRLDTLEVLTGGDGYINAEAVLVVDAGGFYAGDNVELVLSEIGTSLANIAAAAVSVADADGYFAGSNVEAVLAELAAQATLFLTSVTASQVSITDTDGYYISTDVEGALLELGETTEILDNINIALDFISGHIETPQDKIYYMVINAPYSGNITRVTTRSASGTATATVSINGTPLGGAANAVSSSEQSQTHSSANNFIAGDDIELTISSNLSTIDMRFTIRFIRTS